MSDANDLRQPDDREFVPSVTTGDTKAITPEALARLDALEKAATPGPWQADGLFVGQEAEFYQRLVFLSERSADLQDECGSEDSYDEQRKANCQLVAELRNKLPAIRATIAQQARRIAELEKLNRECAEENAKLRKKFPGTSAAQGAVRRR